MSLGMAKAMTVAVKSAETQALQQPAQQTIQKQSFEEVLKEKSLERPMEQHTVQKTAQLNQTQGLNEEVNQLHKMLEDNKASSEQMMEMYGLGEKDAPAFRAVSAENVNFDLKSYSQEQDIRSQHKILDLLSEVNRGQLHMESILELATSGRGFKPQELLALQAGVYQIAQELEITSKVAENFSMNVRTLMNTNFQAA